MYLVTGGAGFIGSHLCDALVARGDRVLILDDLSTGRLSNVEHLLTGPAAAEVELVRGSVQDEALLDRLMEGADATFHLAASVGVELVIRNPLACVLNNVRGTQAVLEAARRTRTRVLVTSTSEIYGKNAWGPLDEEADRILGSPFKARWSYSTSKAVDEILAFGYWRTHGVPTVVARLFNCSGPRQSDAYGMVLPRFVRQALRGEDLTVHGDGSQSRCFCHVADAVAALMALIGNDTAVGDVFNVGARNETTILGLARLVLELTGSRSGIRFVPYAEAYEPGFEDMQRRLPDTAKLCGLTGWTPTRSLADIVEAVIEHQAALIRGDRT